MNPIPHLPVLLDDVLHALQPDSAHVRHMIDGTLGAGGHTLALVNAGAESVLGLDVDPDALALARTALEPVADRVVIRQASYRDMASVAQSIGWQGVDGILLDLGVSSMQLDRAARGFAFMQDGPLDMRFNPTGDRPPASEIINYWDEGELTAIFFKYGEERHSRRIARAIVQQRPFETTRQLAAVIAQAVPKGKQTIHPATRVFQALRIAVNDELATIEATLPDAIDLLNPGGRLAVISFHSLEDRIVKQVFKEASTEIVSPPGMMLEEKVATIRLVTRKPIVASDEEIARNPRSRSAKLRVAEKR